MAAIDFGDGSRRQFERIKNEGKKKVPLLPTIYKERLEGGRYSRVRVCSINRVRFAQRVDHLGEGVRATAQLFHLDAEELELGLDLRGLVALLVACG